MIKFSRFRLDNGLRILVHEDRSTPLVAINILYDVGARDEDPGSTGLAHLSEHLMFSGTERVPEFDKHLMLAGGENNAFTNSDITSYYITVPAANIETGLWLESDRMGGPGLSEKNLEIQKKVVAEEFNQRYLNQPYGDAMLLLKPLAYMVHPYRWPAIGSDISHIRSMKMSKVKEFFTSHYAPDNAILSVTGNITPQNALRLIRKWFEKNKGKGYKLRRLPAEPQQNEPRALSVERDIPASAIYKAWHAGPRISTDFYTLDLITDMLAGGESGRLTTRLIRGKKLFSEINSYLTSDIDPGLVILYGKLMKGIDPLMADESVNNVIKDLRNKIPTVNELEKVKNKYESANIYGNTNILNKALNLSYFELLGDPDLINREVDIYRKNDKYSILETAGKYLIPENCSTLYYNSVRNEME